jgi:hypothetical protein
MRLAGGGVGSPWAIQLRIMARLREGWSSGTMCPARATRTNDSGPRRRKLPPAHVPRDALQMRQQGSQKMDDSHEHHSVASRQQQA